MRPSEVEFLAKTIDGAGNNISHALKLLGNADAATPMGGLEALGAIHKESMDNVADAIRDLADAVRNSNLSKSGAGR